MNYLTRRHPQVVLFIGCSGVHQGHVELGGYLVHLGLVEQGGYFGAEHRLPLNRGPIYEPNFLGSDLALFCRLQRAAHRAFLVLVCLRPISIMFGCRFVDSLLLVVGRGFFFPGVRRGVLIPEPTHALICLLPKQVLRSLNLVEVHRAINLNSL